MLEGSSPLCKSLFGVVGVGHSPLQLHTPLPCFISFAPFNDPMDASIPIALGRLSSRDTSTVSFQLRRT